MNQVIIYPNDTGGIALVIPSGELSIKDVVAKDVPFGKPYLIVEYDDLPEDHTFFDSWEADFTNAKVAGL